MHNSTDTDIAAHSSTHIDLLLLNECEADEKLDRIVKDAALIFGAPIAMINIVAPDSLVFKACIGTVQGNKLERHGSFCNAAISQDQPLNIVDAAEDALFKDHPVVTGPLKVRSYLGKSLKAPDGTPVATLCLLDTKPRKYTLIQKRALTELARAAESEIARIIRSLEFVPPTQPPLVGTAVVAVPA